MTPTPPPIAFDGTVAQYYDDNLGPFLLEPYARDLVARADASATHALELACGTGQVTELLAAHLLPMAHLIATDLNAGMWALGQRKITDSNVSWATVDMSAIPYADQEFDLVACQFGVMFVPDKARAFAEMYRVLKPGGQLLFNTWGPIAENPVWAILNAVTSSFFGPNPAAIAQGPFSMQDEQATLHGLEVAGFSHRQVQAVRLTGRAASAETAAQGFVLGTPLFGLIQQRDPALLPAILEALEKEFSGQLGNRPLQSPLHAWVFEARK